MGPLSRDTRIENAVLARLCLESEHSEVKMFNVDSIKIFLMTDPVTDTGIGMASCIDHA